MKRRIEAKVLPVAGVLLAGLMVAHGCDKSGGEAGGTSSAKGPDLEPVPASVGWKEDADQQEAPEGGRVLVDLSGSMQGFANAGETNIESVYRKLFGSFSAVEAVPLDVCTVGEGETECGEEADPTELREASVYDASSSLLAEAIAPVEAGQEEKSPVDEKGLTVLMTDGLDVGRGTREKESKELFCIPGPESFCLQRALIARAEQGYGIWLVGLSLPFEGRVYPERGLDESMFEETKAHLKTLREESGFASGAGEMGVRSLHVNKGSGRSNYFYEGARPLLFFVMSRDVERGQSFVDRLTDSLQKAEVATPADRLEAVRLTPYQPGRYSFQGVALPAKARGSASLQKQRGTWREDSGLQAEYRCSGRKPTPLHLKLGMDTPPKPELTGQLSESANVGLVSAPSEKSVRPPSELEDQLGVHLSGVNCLHLSAGSHRVVYDLKVGLEYTKGEGQTWWNEWNAPNTYETPERVYRIREIVEAVMATNEQSPELADRAVIHLKK